MTLLLPAFFRHHAQHFREDRPADAAKSYRVPLPVSFNDQFYILRRREDVFVALTAVTNLLAESDLKDLRFGVRRERRQRQHYGCALVDWYSPTKCGAIERRCRAWYYVTRHRGLLCIEMLEFVHPSEREIADCYIAASVPTSSVPPYKLPLGRTIH